MYNSSDKRLVILYSITHFLVDLSCIFMVTAFIIPVLGSRMDWLWCMLMYNFCAFAMQMPIGAVIDSVGRPKLFASAGCAMISVSYLIALTAPYSAVSAQDTEKPACIMIPILACLVAGIGNSCFHAGGGVSILGISRRKAALSGIYVSTGAFGVYLAPKLAAAGGLVYSWSALIGILMMIISAVVLFYDHRKNRNVSISSFTEMSDICEPSRALEAEKKFNADGDGRTACPVKSAKVSTAMITAVTGLFFTVCIRSYTGTVMSFSWKSVPMLGFLFTAGIVLGKLAGGIIGDRLGWMKVSVGSLTVSAALFSVAAKLPAAGIIGVFLFNMTMPITLTALANIFESNHGFAFGMTTFALFLGTLPSMLGDSTTVAGTVWMIPLVVLISAVFLGIGLMCYNRIEKSKGKKIRAGDNR